MKLSIKVAARVFTLAATLNSDERAIMAALSAGQFVGTENFKRRPIVSLAEKGYVVIGKTVKLTHIGRKVADVCLDDATRIIKAKKASKARVYDDPRDPMFNTYDD